MTLFYSVLYPTEESAAQPRRTEMPACFGDLQLDVVMKRALQGDQHIGLEEYFYNPVTDLSVIRYRQEILQELEDGEVRAAVTAVVDRFASLRETMDGLRQKFLGAVENREMAGVYGRGSQLNFLLPKQAENWLDLGRILEKSGDFIEALSDFAESVLSLSLRSEGLRRFGEYVAAYCRSEHFRDMAAEARRLRAVFDEMRYFLWFKSDGSAVKVLPYEEQEDYVSGIEALFTRFRQGSVQDFRRRLEEEPVSERMENEILKLLARRRPREFGALRDFCMKYLDFDDETVLRFAREVRFYLGWLEMTAALRVAGLSFCCPDVQERPETSFAEDCFDLALALRKSEGVVPNGFSLTPPEQILVVTGPNQGGKSTFARAFGQVHYLASLGLTVPGRAARLPLCDGVLTHFEREEKLKDLNGKLRDDLRRLKKLLDAATPRSVFVVNEIFASTTAWDALVLSRHMLDAMAEKGGPAVVITFLEELADYGPGTVSMAAEAREDGRRSFRILRRKPGGRSYAEMLAERRGLTYEEIKRRVGA